MRLQSAGVQLAFGLFGLRLVTHTGALFFFFVFSTFIVSQIDEIINERIDVMCLKVY